MTITKDTFLNELNEKKSKVIFESIQQSMLNTSRDDFENLYKYIQILDIEIKNAFDRTGEAAYACPYIYKSLNIMANCFGFTSFLKLKQKIFFNFRKSPKVKWKNPNRNLTWEQLEVLSLHLRRFANIANSSKYSGIELYGSEE